MSNTDTVTIYLVLVFIVTAIALGALIVGESLDHLDKLKERLDNEGF